MDDTSKVMVFDGWDFQPASAFPQLGSVGSPNHGRQQDDPPAHAIRECDRRDKVATGETDRQAVSQAAADFWCCPLAKGATGFSRPQLATLSESPCAFARPAKTQAVQPAMAGR